MELPITDFPILIHQHQWYLRAYQADRWIHELGHRKSLPTTLLSSTGIWSHWEADMQGS